MKKLFVKSLVYFFLILLVLEVIMRVFHLTKDYPTRYVDEFNVEKWMPNQEGYSVTGVRRQNFSEYRINNSGYNSYREFKPTKDKVEIALVGDSFIEGFHQHYYNSIGFKIEKQLKDIEVYEYGYAGYDLADQLHLMHQYKSTFDLIDYVFIGLNFEYDLERADYGAVYDRMKLETTFYRSIREFKLLVYLQNIGVFDSYKNLITKLLYNTKSKKQNVNSSKVRDQIKNKELKFKKNIQNFENLIKIYGFDKSRFIFLLDLKKTPQKFTEYLNKNNFKFLDYSEALRQSKTATTLIYDMHWNSHGRNIVASEIVNYLNSKN